MNHHEQILVLDFGGQYNLLIARRVRELNVYCEIKPYTMRAEEIKARCPKGIILTGGPASVFEENAPKCDPEIWNLGIPVLGICYGQQLMCQTLGGEVSRADMREYGKTELLVEKEGMLLRDVPKSSTCWMSHTNFVSQVPEGFCITATTAHCPAAAVENPARGLYGVQLHPEVNHTEHGMQIL